MTNTTVIKLGGSLLEDATRRSVALRLIVGAWQRGKDLVLVHGGGKKIDATLARLGIPKRTHAGLRITDEATLEVVVSVLAGIVNKSLVAELSALGIRAAGISGSDGNTVMAEIHPPIDGIDLGHVGRVTGSSPTLIRSMLNYGMLPVVSSIAQGHDGALLNVNADTVAAAVAASLGARSLIFLTDVAGFLDENGTLVDLLTDTDAEARIAGGQVTGGMRPKLEAAVGALRSGVSEVVIAGPENHGDALAGETGGTHLVAA
ncbi:MAG TPA: acetylglutamate kinase [Thermoanaerobaculia bacterium]|nr:acetylglutamate kinase [Thermoanaerobaculia bacterium]